MKHIISKYFYLISAQSKFGHLKLPLLSDFHTSQADKPYHTRTTMKYAVKQVNYERLIQARQSHKRPISLRSLKLVRVSTLLISGPPLPPFMANGLQDPATDPRETRSLSVNAVASVPSIRSYQMSTIRPAQTIVCDGTRTHDDPKIESPAHYRQTNPTRPRFYLRNKRKILS